MTGSTGKAPAHGNFNLEEPVHITWTAFRLLIGDEERHAPMSVSLAYPASNDHLGAFGIGRPGSKITFLQWNIPRTATGMALPNRLSFGVLFAQVLAPVSFGLKRGLCQIEAEA